MTSAYEQLGGTPFFERLAAAFYRNVERDAPLRAMYPTDLGEATRSLALFLQQYFGGPDDYSVAKGHPRLRMRHAHLAIDNAARDSWFAAMSAAIDEVSVEQPLRSAMLEYFTTSADWMINTEEAQPQTPGTSE